MIVGVKLNVISVRKRKMTTKLCGNCEARLLDTWIYCPMCGGKIGEEITRYTVPTTTGGTVLYSFDFFAFCNLQALIRKKIGTSPI